MASVIWPNGNRWKCTQTQKLLRGIFKNNTKVVDQTGDAVIIAKGNRYEGIEAKE